MKKAKVSELQKGLFFKFINLEAYKSQSLQVRGTLCDARSHLRFGQRRIYCSLLLDNCIFCIRLDIKETRLPSAHPLSRHIRLRARRSALRTTKWGEIGS